MSKTNAQRAFLRACESLKPQAPVDETSAIFVDTLSMEMLEELDNAEVSLESMLELMAAMERPEGNQPVTREQLMEFAQRAEECPLFEVPAIPSQESFDSFPDNAVAVSMEGLRDSVKKAIRSIITYMVEVWKRMMAWFEEMARSTALIKMRSTLARTRINDVQGRFPQTKTLDVAAFVPLITTDRMPVIDYRRVSEHMLNMNRQLERVRQQYLPMVTGVAQTFITLYDRGAVGSNEWLAGLNDAAQRYNPEAAINLSEAFTNTANTLFPIGAKMGRPLPGRRSIVCVKPDAERLNAATSPVELARALQTSQVQLAELRDDTGRDEIEMEMEVLGVTHLYAILDSVDNVIREIDRSANDNSRRTIRALTVRLDTITRGMGDMDDGTVEAFRAGMAYARSLVRWCREPYFSLINHAGNVCNNVIRLCNLNTKAYWPESEGSNP